MSLCPSCQSELSEHALYCKVCGVQARCKACQQSLESNSNFCGACGVAISRGASVIDEKADGVTPSSPRHTVNHIKFDETSKSRSFEGHLTDEAMSHIRDAFALYAGGSIEGNINPKKVSPITSRQLPEPSTSSEIAEGLILNDNDISQDNVLIDDEEKLKRIFRASGDQLKLIETRLKAKNRFDFAQRLTYLFLYAHELAGQDHVQRDKVEAVLKDADVWFPNSWKWLPNASELSHEADKYGLKIPAREAAQAYLQEVFDSSVQNTWSLGTSSKSRHTKTASSAGSNKKGSNSQGSSSSNSSSDVQQWVEKWRQLNLGIDGFERTKDRPVAERGIFGLWALGKALDDSQVIVSRDKLVDFLHLCFGIKASKAGSFDKALTSTIAKGKVVKVKGGYQLLPAGIEFGEQIAGVKDTEQSRNATQNPKKR